MDWTNPTAWTLLTAVGTLLLVPGAGLARALNGRGDGAVRAPVAGQEREDR